MRATRGLVIAATTLSSLSLGTSTAFACAAPPGPSLDFDRQQVPTCLQINSNFNDQIPRVELVNTCPSAATATPVDCESCSEAVALQPGDSEFIVLGKDGEQGSTVVLWTLEQPVDERTEGDVELNYAYYGGCSMAEEGCSTGSREATFPPIVFAVFGFVAIRTLVGRRNRNRSCEGDS